MCLVVRDMHDSMKVLLMSLLLAIVASTAFSVWAANKVADRTSDQAVCQILSVNIDTYAETPPQTPAGKNLAKKYVELFRQQCR